MIQSFLFALAPGLILGALLSFIDATQASGLARFQCRLGNLNETMRLEFNHDTTTNRATMVGIAGTSDVVPHVSAGAITFLEFLATGAVQSTTIVLATGEAVHSRHSIVGKKLVPTQYRGTCTSLPSVG